MKRGLALLSSCLGMVVSQPLAAGAEAPVSVEVGGREIRVPIPAEGFVRCDGVNADWDKGVASFIPASNRLLAYFCTAADGEALRNREEVELAVNYNLQTLRSLENEEVGTKTFASVSGSMRKEVEGMQSKLDAEIKKMMDRGNAHITEQMKVDSALSLSDVAVLGFFDEQNAEALGFTMALNLKGKVAGEDIKQRSVVASYVVPANGRLLLLYATRPFGSDADRQEAERAVKAWGDAIIASNAKIEGEAIGKPEGGIFRNVGKSAAIGAVGGALVALILVLLKKRKAAA